jgi:hypothetical protein
MKSLIIGNGEIGKSLHKIIGGDITGITITPERYDIIHIAFPYSDEFVGEVKRYQDLYLPKYTVIHSTVPVGTSKKCNAIHSPIIGIHPHLEESIKTFTKFLGGEKSEEVADYFRRFGIKIYICDNSETTELAKLSQTTQYALNIEYIKDLKIQCDKLGLPFSEVYTLFTDNYNNGYNKLGYSEYRFPLLIPIMKKQGGHCTIPNCNLWETDFTEFIKKLNTRETK